MGVDADDLSVDVPYSGRQRVHDDVPHAARHSARAVDRIVAARLGNGKSLRTGCAARLSAGRRFALRQAGAGMRHEV